MVLNSVRDRRRVRSAAGGDGAQTLAEHLSELRHRVLVALAAVLVGSIVGFVLYEHVLGFLVGPYCDVLPAGRACKLVVLDPIEGFSVRLKVSAYVGLLLAAPVVLWQLWRFITPALHPQEKRYAIPFVGSATGLFVLGAALALWSFPRALAFLTEVGGQSLEALYSPGGYLSLLVFMMMAFGIGFEFPVVLFFLQVAGVLHWRTLASARRYAVVTIFAAAAVITPSGDPVTLVTLALPLCFFYELNVVVGRRLLRRP